MTQNLTTSQNPEQYHCSGIATISHKLADGLGALHIRVQMDQEEKRFMFSALDFSRLITGKMIQGYDREDYQEEACPITAKKLGDRAVFEAYGTHVFSCGFMDLRDLWSFNKPGVFLTGPATASRIDTIIQIGCRAMDRIFPADIYPCKVTAGA